MNTICRVVLVVVWMAVPFSTFNAFSAHPVTTCTQFSKDTLGLILACRRFYSGYFDSFLSCLIPRYFTIIHNHYWPDLLSPSSPVLPFFLSRKPFTIYTQSPSLEFPLALSRWIQTHEVWSDSSWCHAISRSTARSMARSTAVFHCHRRLPACLPPTLTSETQGTPLKSLRPCWLPPVFFWGLL